METYLVGADFSSLEMRIITLLSGDEKYLQWYNEGIDPHKKTASAFFGPAFDDGSPDLKKRMRDVSKNIAYSLHYNLSSDVSTVWKTLVVRFPDISINRVQQFRTFYFKEHPAIRTWQISQVSNAERAKHIRSPLSGRQISFYDGRVDPNVCLNAPMQMTAADLTNRAILAIDEALDWSAGEAVLAQVHDAIYLEGPDPFRLYDILRTHMEQTVTLNGHTMKFPVDIGIATDWRDAGTLKVTKVPQCSFQEFLSSLDWRSTSQVAA